MASTTRQGTVGAWWGGDDGPESNIGDARGPVTVTPVAEAEGAVCAATPNEYIAGERGGREERRGRRRDELQGSERGQEEIR